MAQARRKSSGGKKRRGGRGFVLLLLGIGIGVGVVYLWQLVSTSFKSRGGIASLLEPASKPAERAPEAPRSEAPRKEPARSGKPRYEFYTLLQNETVLPDREPAAKPGKPAKSEESISYVLQAGAFASFEDADQLKARLALSGLVAQIQKIEVEGHTYHRVRLGPYDKVEQLDAAADQLGKLGIRALRVKVKKGAG